MGITGKCFGMLLMKRRCILQKQKPEVQDFAASRGRTLWRGQQETL